MIVIRRGGERPLRKIELGRGVVLHARALDALDQAQIAAAVEAEFDAIKIGAPLRDWGALPARIAGEGDEREVQVLKQGWMWGVLLAERAVETIEGVQEEDGTPAKPSFDLFVTLLLDVRFEALWRLGARGLNELWDAEKNVSGREQSGLSAAATNSAPPAENSIPLAPVVTPSSTTTEADSAAPLSSTPPAPAPAPAPGG